MPVSERDYQPSLLWTKAWAWYQSQPQLVEDRPAMPYGPHDVTLFVYRRDQPGAYQMTGPKLYWTDEPMGQYFQNVKQDDMLENKDQLGEVVIWDRRRRQTVLIGNTFEKAIERLNS